MRITAIPNRKILLSIVSIALALCVLSPVAESAQSAEPPKPPEPLFEWELTIGADGETAANVMTVSQNGGVLIAGQTNSETLDADKPYGGYDAYVAYVSDNGQLVWQRRFGGTKDDRFTHVIELADGGVVAMGTTLSTDEDAKNARGGLDVFIAYLTREGETVWIKCLGGTGDDEMLAIEEADDGSIFVCGNSGSRNGDLPSNKGGKDAWATFLSRENGRPLQRILDGTPADEQFTQIHKTSSGWLLLGDSAERGWPDDQEAQVAPFALMLSDEGGEVWKVELGGQGVNRLEGVLATDTGYALFGDTNSTSIWMPSAKGGHDLWALSLRINGAVSWQWTYGGTRDERFHSAIQNENGGYFILGTTASDDGHVWGAHGAVDVWVVSISKGGTFGWQQTVGGSEASSPAGILQTADGGVLVAGTTFAQDGDIGRHAARQTGFFARLSVNGNLEWTRLIAPDKNMRLISLSQSGANAYLLGSVYGADGESVRIWKTDGNLLME